MKILSPKFFEKQRQQIVEDHKGAEESTWGINTNYIKNNKKTMVVSAILALIFLSPAFFLLIILMGSGDTKITIFSFLWVILKIVFFIYLIAVVSVKRVRTVLADAVKKPIIITMSFLLSAFFIVYNDFNTFVPTERESFIQLLPYGILIWILFPIIQSKWFIRIVPRWALWFFRIPVWGVIFFSAMILIETFGVSIFSLLS